LEHHPLAVLRMAERDLATFVDEDRRHAHPVDVHPGFASIDRNPLDAVEVQQHLRLGKPAQAVDLHIGAVVGADGDIAVRGKGVAVRAVPDDQEGAERRDRHGRPPFSPMNLGRDSIIQPPSCAEIRP
jgi:hypothetical protein